MFVDEIKLNLRAGKGGDGVERWRHEKGKEFGGPSGGNGGKGGDVYVVAVRDVGILSSYRNVKEFEAGRGGDGSKDLKQGKEGSDIEIKLPIGSRITNLTTGHVIELIKDGERLLILNGGRGGLGNDHFKSSTNVRPKKYTFGEVGEEAEFDIELLLVVDIGIIGLPNAGKSSLLNALTSSKSKVGAFPFTTLEPSLGSFYGLILADIPGLIEGASQGRGLGHKFLRHIERTGAILHCISAESTDPGDSYRVVRKELELYNKEMIKKEEVVVLTKVDMVTSEERDRMVSILKEASGKEVLSVSVIDDNLVSDVGNYLSRNFKLNS